MYLSVWLLWSWQLRLVSACILAQACATCTGCNLAVDVTWKYLNFFMNDDKKLKHIESEYGSGRMLTGEAKAELVKVFECSPESSPYTLRTAVPPLLQIPLHSGAAVCLEVADLPAHKLVIMVHARSSHKDTLCHHTHIACLYELSIVRMQLKMVRLCTSKTIRVTS